MKAGQWWLYRQSNGMVVRVLLVNPSRVVEGDWIARFGKRNGLGAKSRVRGTDLIAETIDPDE